MNISNRIILDSQSSSFKELISKNNPYFKVNKEKGEIVFSKFKEENSNQFNENESWIIFNIFENTLKNLEENLLNKKNFDKKILLSNYTHELDCYKVIFQKVFFDESKMLSKKISRLLNNFKIKLELKYLRDETNEYERKISLKELHIINLNKNIISSAKLPIDFKKNLKINSEEELIHPISLGEEAFIRKYLDTSPQMIKQKAHYELFGVNVEKFLKDLGHADESFITINSEQYKFYNIDYHNYKFIGSSVNANEIVDEYKGFLSGKWPYLCTSIIDETQTFFYEEKYQIFQIFTPSYESIVHTSHLDIRSPWSGRSEQEGWYSMSKKGKVLAAYIYDLYKHFNTLYGNPPLGNITNIDKYIKLILFRNDWLTHLNDQLALYKMTNQNLLSGVIANVMKLLTDHESRKNFMDNQDLIDDLELVKFSDKDIQAIKELVDELHSLESEQPEFVEKNKLGSFNNPSEVLDKMIKHYQSKQMNEKEEIEEYIQLFNTDDPQGFYNIINELNSLKEILGYFKPIGNNQSFSPHLNRIMGPEEILALSHKLLNNEINFDTYTKERIKVRAWIVSMSLLEDKKNNLEILHKIFTLAKHENIHVLVRKPLFNFFVNRKKETSLSHIT